MVRVEDVLHASRAAPRVAVVEVEAFALQDERTDAILGFQVSIFRRLGWSEHTWAVDVVRKAVRGILQDYRDPRSIPEACDGIAK